MNTGRIRVVPRSEADEATLQKCLENLRGGGGWTFVGERTYTMLSCDRGTGRVALAWQGQGIERLVVGVLVWEESLAHHAWTNFVGQAAEFLALPRLARPSQLPWLAAYLTADALGQSKSAIRRLGVVSRTAAWAILEGLEGARED